MQLLSIGDQVQKGVYTLHSSFERVQNYALKDCDNSTLLVLATYQIGNGPTSIVVGEDTLANIKIDSIEIGEELTFNCNGKETKLKRPNKVYDSQPKLTGDRLEQNLATLKNFVARNSSQNSLVFLIDAKQELNLRSSYEKELAKRVREGTNQIFIHKDLKSGIKLLRGVGPGLTPSGDDFITGLLAAIKLTELQNKYRLTNLKKTILQNAKGSNPYSNTYIHHASEGNFSEKVKVLLEALPSSNSPSFIEESAMNILNFGSTSGADLLAGLIIGLERSNEWLLKD